MDQPEQIIIAEAPEALPPKRERRYKRIPIDPAYLYEMIMGHLRIVDVGVPPDSLFERVSFDDYSQCFTIVVSHPSFDDVPSGECLPLAWVTVSPAEKANG